jgi:two-component system chemotaxis response regulator CheB
MKRLRVLVVDDSLTVRKRIAAILSADSRFEVVGEAADGGRAIELCEALRPDVMTLDMMLPVKTGLDVTEHVMAYCPTPILIVSSSMNRGEVFQTFEALAAGAVDVLDKPRQGGFGGEWDRTLAQAVKLVSSIPVITHPRMRLGAGSGHFRTSQPKQSAALPAAPEAPARVAPALVAIGASTGGPTAVSTVVRGLARRIPVPVIAVVHVAEAFVKPLVDWLGASLPLPVRLAEDRQPLPSSAQLIVAPANRHLVVEAGRLRLTDDPERHSCRPSVDVLFESVARDLGRRAIGCLLTGIGRDGAAGLLAMRRAGALTLAQDEATSVVYGMPREAAQMNAVDQLLPVDRIAEAILRQFPSGADSGKVESEPAPR